jgi:hypothetical protein
MRAIFITLLLALVPTAATEFGRERWAESQADRAASAGHHEQAYLKYQELTLSRPWFLDRSELIVRTEAEAASVLPAAIRRHDYVQAVHLGNLILGGPDSGYETEANAAAFAMPDQQIEYMARLLDEGRIDDALRECDVARPMYSGRPQVLGRLRTLEARVRVAGAERAVASGDSLSARELLSQLDPMSPQAVLSRAEDMVRQATATRADWLVARRDFPGLLRWFATARNSVRDRTNLQRAANLEYVNIAHRVFEIPPSGVPTLEVDEPPAATAIGSTGSGLALLAIGNRTSEPITVLLRGTVNDYRAVVGPGGRTHLKLRPGEYAEAVRGGAGPVPYLGVIRLTAAGYSQDFDLKTSGAAGPIGFENRVVTARLLQ